MSALAWMPHPSRSAVHRLTRTSPQFWHRVQSSLSVSSSISSDPSPDGSPPSVDLTVEHRTRTWLETVVIGMNLCPFAERPNREQRVAIQMCWSKDDVEIIHNVLQECDRRRDVPGTTLIVCPECHSHDFGSYLDVLQVVEEELSGRGLATDIQVAPFHPHFVFDGASGTSPDNWTNRSPYPTFHVLREEEVSVAVDKLDGDAGRVWKRNVNLLNDLQHELGRDDFERFMSIDSVDANRRGTDTLYSNLLARVNEIVRRFRSQV